MAVAFEETELTQLADDIAAEIACRPGREWVDACDYPAGMSMTVVPVHHRREPFAATLWSSEDETVAEVYGSLCLCAAFVLAQRTEQGAR